MTEGTEDPFVILGIVPTDSLAKIKLAYFAALKLHPPQSDPEGFRRLRTAGSLHSVGFGKPSSLP